MGRAWDCLCLLLSPAWLQVHCLSVVYDNMEVQIAANLFVVCSCTWESHWVRIGVRANRWQVGSWAPGRCLPGWSTLLVLPCLTGLVPQMQRPVKVSTSPSISYLPRTSWLPYAQGMQTDTSSSPSQTGLERECVPTPTCILPPSLAKKKSTLSAAVLCIGGRWGGGVGRVKRSPLWRDQEKGMVAKRIEVRLEELTFRLLETWELKTTPSGPFSRETDVLGSLLP